MIGAAHPEAWRLILVPVFLGEGVRLFDLGSQHPSLEIGSVIQSPTVTHLRYRVAK